MYQYGLHTCSAAVEHLLFWWKKSAANKLPYTSRHPQQEQRLLVTVHSLYYGLFVQTYYRLLIVMLYWSRASTFSFTFLVLYLVRVQIVQIILYDVEHVVTTLRQGTLKANAVKRCLHTVTRQRMA